MIPSSQDAFDRPTTIAAVLNQDPLVQEYRTFFSLLNWSVVEQGQAQHSVYEGDITYFRPLYQRSVVALQGFPTYITADAAFDAWYVYECAARHGGMAAIPLNKHSVIAILSLLL